LFKVSSLENLKVLSRLPLGIQSRFVQSKTAHN
jgi:hypothetical protein